MADGGDGAERGGDGEEDDLGIGERLRALRRRAGLRLKDVAARANCSESMLSKIETGHVSPSINLLHRIARIYGTHLGALFGPPVASAPFVQRAGRRQAIVAEGPRRGAGIRLENLTPFEIAGLLQAQLHVLEPGAASDGAIAHEGEEVGFVVEGALELTVDGRTERLETGDSFFFASARPHAYRNPGTTIARIVWVNTPPTY